MKKFDLLTVIGMVGGIILLSIAVIAAGSLTGAKAFLSVSSILTVLGGLTASMLINFNTKELKGTIFSVKEVFIIKEQNISKLVDKFVHLSTMARREGLLALDREIEDINDPFIKKGILLTVDGLEAEVIKEILMAEVIAIEEKQKIARNVVSKAGEMAPAWGMIGTLIGLVLMLQNLDDPSTIGPSMALALVTTFYGAVLANLFFIPLAGKLGNRTDNDIYIKQIMIEGILGVQSGQNPKLLKEKLEAFIDEESKEEEIDESTASDMNEEVTI